MRCEVPLADGRYRAPEFHQGHPSHDACWNRRHDPDACGRWIASKAPDARSKTERVGHIELSRLARAPSVVALLTEVGASRDSARTSVSGPHEAAIDATRSAASRYPPQRRFQAERIVYLPDTPVPTPRSVVRSSMPKGEELYKTALMNP